MYNVGQMVGAILAVYILYFIWEIALFKRVMDDPVKGKLASSAAGYLTAAAISGFGMADGGPYAWQAFGIYLPAGLIVGFFAYRKGVRLRGRGVEIAETFS